MRLPPPFSWFYEAWMEFSQALGKIMSWIILTILWIVGFGLYAVAARAAALFRKRQTDAGWLDVPKPLPDDLHRQF